MTATIVAAHEKNRQGERPCIQWGSVDITEFDEYSDDEAKEVWYDDNELGAISYEALRLASQPNLTTSQSHMRGSHAEDHDSMRGLEEMTVRGSIGRLQGQASVRKAVFHEQLRQQSMGFCDPTLISIVSRAESFLDIRRALELGREDQESADEILQRVREPPNVAPSTKSSPKEKSRIRGCAKHARMSVGRRMMRFFSRRKV